MPKFKIGDECCYIVSGQQIVTGIITAVHGDFYTIKYDADKGIRLHSHRLYHSLAEAQEKITKPKHHNNPYDYPH